MTAPKTKFWTLLLGTGLALSPTASAIPFLQIDIGGGTYDPGHEDVVTSSDTFTLYTLVDAFKNNGSPTNGYSPGEDYFVSVSFGKQDQTNPDPDFGSFSVTSAQPFTQSALLYGTPSSLSSHGQFSSYYYELAFTALPGTSSDYNVEDNPGGPSTGTGLLYNAFDFDVTGLEPGVSLHFDFYTDSKFAPYSPDASYNPPKVPDGGTTLALFGLALLGLSGCKKLARVS